MGKKNDDTSYPKGTGLAIGLIFSVTLALVTGNNGMFVIGIAIGAAIETTYIK